MFRINNKISEPCRLISIDIRTMSIDVVLMSVFSILKLFCELIECSIANFEHELTGWDVNHLMPGVPKRSHILKHTCSFNLGQDCTQIQEIKQNRFFVKCFTTDIL